MTGTIVNAIGIIVGGLLGLLFKRGIPERINNAILKVVGIAVLIVGLNGVLTAMLSVGGDGRLTANGIILLFISLAAGCVAGELIRIEDRLNSFSDKIEKKLKADNFTKGFVTASIVFVVGALGIVGAINDGLTGDSTVLFTKAMLDGITAILLAATLGFGVPFSAAPVFIYQGAIAMLARFIAPYITDDFVRMFSMVGYAIVVLLGFNFLADIKARVANLLPALAFPIIYYIISINFL